MSTYIRRRSDPSDRLSGDRWGTFRHRLSSFRRRHETVRSLRGWQIAKVTLLLATALALALPITIAHHHGFYRRQARHRIVRAVSLVAHHQRLALSNVHHITTTSLLLAWCFILLISCIKTPGDAAFITWGLMISFSSLAWVYLAAPPGASITRDVRQERYRLRSQHGSLRRSREYAVRKGMATLGRHRSHRHDASRHSQNRVSSRLRHPGRGWTLRALAVSDARARPRPPLHRGHRAAGARLCVG